jgi:aminoglycoside 3-N-acetyltransferase
VLVTGSSDSCPAAGGDDTDGLVTRERIAGDLRALGVRAGHTLLVHASLRSIGYVDGGAPTVVAALRDAVGDSGNIVVPASTEANSLTSRAHRARIARLSAAEAKNYRDAMPAFDPASTPGGAGAIAEAVRTAKGAFRSEHPQSSFAAIGPLAWDLMANHSLDCHLGEDSPLGHLYKLDRTFVLLLGVGYKACTALHLAEYRYTANPPRRTYACVVATDGRRHWAAYRDVVLDDHQFGVIGDYIDAQMVPRAENVGNAKGRLLRLSDLVDHATEWMRINRR